MKLPKVISQDEFEKLYTAEKNKQYKLAYLLGFEAGMRLSEIVGYKDRVPRLEPFCIDLKGHTIKILSGKGKKDRVVPLPKRFNEAMLKLLPLILPRRTLQEATRRQGLKQLGRIISFHTLRHGFGSCMANRGMPLHEIQMLMGHSRMDTTGIYLHASPEKAIERARELF